MYHQFNFIIAQNDQEGEVTQLGKNSKFYNFAYIIK
jgi:hypothetical protein